jgi:CheY-like chemotaxis protein
MSEALIVGHAASGEEALQMVDKLQPDVILMDVSMAGMGGNRDHETTARW